MVKPEYLSDAVRDERETTLRYVKKLEGDGFEITEENSDADGFTIQLSRPAEQQPGTIRDLCEGKCPGWLIEDMWPNPTNGTMTVEVMVDRRTFD